MKAPGVLVAAFAFAATPGAVAQQAARAPLYQAFAANFDATAPLTLSGRIVRADWLEPSSVIWVEGSPDGGAKELWRVDTSAASLFSDADRTALTAGADVRIRGYEAKDTRCTPTCRMAGRDFSMPDHPKVPPRLGHGVCSMDQLTRETCLAASRPGPPPDVASNQ